MIHKDPLPDGENVRVIFELPSSMWAERVNLVGDFNDWDTTRDEMRQSRDSDGWRISLVLPKGRAYQFRYLINGQDWQNDWHADKYARNKFGTDDSVVVT
jgi:1,4-alpha-glucan branching enzyme